MHIKRINTQQTTENAANINKLQDDDTKSDKQNKQNRKIKEHT